ncbi:MAG TPA: LysR family transcriptional regulator [Actinocrinis sp.]|nr:LysR family transcriptional regulator [Actinocrinis sp.]
MQLDLNLLTALDALLEEGSVAAAADRLYLSAPAMSRTLGRIRQATGDQILVRTGRTMTPTPYALSVRAQVHELVAQAHAVLSPERGLDLANLVRAFTLQCHDAVTTAVGPRLLDAVRTQAPNVALRLLPEATVDTLDLKHGHIDLEVGSGVPDLPEIRSEVIAEDHLVLAMRADHPLAPARTQAPLTLADYAAASHVTVSRRGRLSDRVDQLLESRGFARQVVATAPTSTAALYFVQQSDLLTVVPERMCHSTIAMLGLTTAPIPLPLPPSPIVAAWHQRYDNDRAHTWLRETVKAAVDSLR